MKFVSEPPISIKVNKMKERVRWSHPLITERGIDQTRLALADGKEDSPDFSFLVIGDSGSTIHKTHHPQRKVALMMLEHIQSSRFVLHTGDVVYQVGSSEYYLDNFIKPYRELLLGGDRPENIPYDRMVFNLPFLPVLGNHDYYDLSPLSIVLALITLPFRYVFRFFSELNFHWHGSNQGDAYARAFLDYLQNLDPNSQLPTHLDRYYTEKTNTGRCLSYQPNTFTRLPNRYYTFRSGGIDFFALDSNTFNQPSPLPATPEGDQSRRDLEKLRGDLEKQELQLLETSSKLHSHLAEEAEQIEDLQAELQQIEESKLDIDKQLEADETNIIDFEQLNWLRQKLIESWNSPEVRGRVLYFHHAPYVTESSKWNQAQTLAVRYHLRWVLDRVSETVGKLAGDRPIVDLILNGHAHCLEYIRTEDTGHADSHLNYIVCGGSGFSLRRQRSEGGELRENTKNGDGRIIARSQLFMGKHGYAYNQVRPYSGLRIDVKDGIPPKFIIRPFVSERFQGKWRERFVEPFII